MPIVYPYRGDVVRGMLTPFSSRVYSPLNGGTKKRDIGSIIIEENGLAKKPPSTIVSLDFAPIKMVIKITSAFYKPLLNFQA